MQDFERVIDLNYASASQYDEVLMLSAEFVQTGHRPKVIDIADCSIKRALSHVSLMPLTALESLEGIGKNYFTEIRGTLYLPTSIKRNMLGLCLVKYLFDTDYNISLKEVSGDGIVSSTINFMAAESIITSGRWELRKEEMLDRKEELIAKGLKEYAKL